MKIVFLDFDGVLNSWAFFEMTKGARAEEGITDLERWVRKVDPAAVAELDRICTTAGADVVVSSTWRQLHALADLRQILERRGFTGRIIGKTPRLPPHGVRSCPRGLEIQEWLDATRRPVESFVILDDDNDMEHLIDRLVLTSFRTGLTAGDADKAINVLRRPYER